LAINYSLIFQNKLSELLAKFFFEIEYADTGMVPSELAIATARVE